MDFNYLLEMSVQQQASDLHLSPGLPPMLRIDGALRAAENTIALDANSIKSYIYRSMNKEQQQLFEKMLEFDFVVNVPHLAGFRVHAFYQTYGIAAVFRIIPKKIPTLDELELPSIVKTMLNSSNGLILVTGATGCGKSTTLAAMINYINNHQSVQCDDNRRSH